MKTLHFLLAFVGSIIILNSQTSTTIDYMFPDAKEPAKITIDEYEDYYLYQGDIYISKDKEQLYRGVEGYNVSLWPCGVIPYQIATSTYSNADLYFLTKEFIKITKNKHFKNNA